MEELIFIALIFFFSLIESIARKKRQRGGAEAPELPEEWSPEEDESERWQQRQRRLEPEPEADAGSARRTQERSGARGRPRPRPEEGSGASMPTYDADTSYDEETLDAMAGPRAPTPSPSSSEGMVPADLWKEIEKLSRSRSAELPEAKPVPKPRPSPKPAPSRAPVPSRSSTTRAGPTPRGKNLPTTPKAPPVPRRAEGHAVHLAHLGFGTDPSERAPSAQDQLDPLARTLSADAAAARKQLRARDPSSLRRAVIMQEILSPPVALRDEPE